MSLSIFDVDGVHSEIIDEKEVKTFIKRCGYDKKNPYLTVEVGAFSKELCDDNAIIDFKLKNIFKLANWEIKDKDVNTIEFIFRNMESCDAFLQALEFAVGVLREARDRAMFQKEEKAF